TGAPDLRPFNGATLTGGLPLPYRSVRCRREPERARRPLPRRARHVHASAVRSGDGTDEAEAEAATAGVVAGLAAVEAVPDPRQLLRRDPRARVAHRDAHALGVPIHPQHDAP